MEIQQKYRIKSAMIIYALEEALGNYVILNEDQISSISEGSKKEIIEREQRKRVVDGSTAAYIYCVVLPDRHDKKLPCRITWNAYESYRCRGKES